MASAEDEVSDVTSRQLEWLRKVREAVNLTGPPPPQVLRSLAPPEDGSEVDRSPDRSKELPTSPVSPKVVEELATLRWENEEKKRTVQALEEMVDLLQTRCRELEDESRELMDLAAAAKKEQQTEAGVPNERREGIDHIASIKERQLSREPIASLGAGAGRTERDSELERLRLRCEELEEERMHLAEQLERGHSHTASESSPRAEDLLARCERLEAEKEKLQKHVERLWQMCQREQGHQGRQASEGELTFEAVVATVSEVTDDRLNLQAEKAQLEAQVEEISKKCQMLEEQLAAKSDANEPDVRRCELLEREKAEVEKELGELAAAHAELQGRLVNQQQLAEAQVAARPEEKAGGEGLEEELGALQARNEALEAEKCSQEEELEELTRLYGELQASLQEETSLRARAEEQLEELPAERLDEGEKRPSTCAACAEAERQLATLAALVETHKTVEATRKIKLEGLQEKHELLEEEHLLLQGKLAASEQALAVLQRCELEPKAVQEATFMAPDLVDEMKEEIARLQGQAHTLETECARRTAQKEELVIQLEEALKKEDESADELRSLTQRLAHAEAAQQQLTQQLSASESQLKESQAKSNSELAGKHADELQSLQQRLADAEAAQQQLTQQLSASESQLKESQAKSDSELAGKHADELHRLQQRLADAEETERRLAMLQGQLQESQAEAQRLSGQLQILSQQLHDSQAAEARLRSECEGVRAQYNSLEADHSDLNLRAEAALAEQAALTTEHRRVVEEVQRLQSQTEGRQSQIEPELLQLKAEKDLLAKQVKQQEEYLQSRQADLKADAERLREENLARADEWKAMMAELSELRGSRSSLETKCVGLTDQVKSAQEECEKQRGLAQRTALECESLRAEQQQLQKKVLDAAAEQQAAAEEAERMRADAAEVEANRRGALRELEEFRRQSQLWAAEKGAAEADSSRLLAANEALTKENEELCCRLQTMAPKSDTEEAYLAAINAAEQWVLYHAGMPLEGSSMPYLRGVTVYFQEFSASLVPLVLATNPRQLRSAAAAVESCELARATLQCFRLCDAQCCGYLSWDAEEVCDLVHAVFQRKGLPTPSKDLQHLMFTKFDEDLSGRLCAQDCLCLVDALFRAVLSSPAAVSARMTEQAPEGPIVSPGVSVTVEARQMDFMAQSRLQRRLEEAERAAQRAVEGAAGSMQEPLTAPGSLAVPLRQLAPCRTALSPPGSYAERTAPNVRLLDPARILHSSSRS